MQEPFGLASCISEPENALVWVIKISETFKFDLISKVTEPKSTM